MRKSSQAPESILRGQTSNMSDLKDSLVYSPSASDKQLKSQFWLKAADNPLVDINNIKLADVHQIMGNTRVQPNCWSAPGFMEWFLNVDENRQRLEYLFTLALDAAESILMNEEPKAQSARVNMVKVISELAGKTPNKQANNGIEKAIGSMDKIQLEAFLQKNGMNMKLTASKDNNTITVVPEDDSISLDKNE